MLSNIKRYLSTISTTYRIFRTESSVSDNFLKWAERYADEKSEVVVRLRTQRRFFKMTDRRLVSAAKSSGRVQFILLSAKEKPEYIGGKAPITIFKSSRWSVYEYPAGVKPMVRHGLSSEERQAALSLVREHLTQALQGIQIESRQNLTQLLSGYNEPVTVDVMLWVNGEMRGSKIYTGSSLIEALCSGVVLSAHDDRFKPLTTSELSVVRFEINIISDLKLPVITPQLGGIDTVIEPSCGYIAVHGARCGWYLPGVFNVKKFPSLAELFSALAYEKIGVTLGLSNKVNFFLFSVEIFREATSGEGVVGMDGPLCVSEISKPKWDYITARTNMMTRWLCTISNEDGYLPLKADPYLKKAYITDWPRMAFAAFALGAYGHMLDKKNCVSHSVRTAAYIRSIYETLNQPLSCRITVNVYLNRLALVGRDYGATKTGAGLLNAFVEQTPDISIISVLQIASFFDELSCIPYIDSGVYGLRAGAIVDDVFVRWERAIRQGEEVSLAEYAELLPLMYARARAGDGSVRELAKERYETLRKWYLSKQLDNGAFPNTTRSDYCYTRGTGKIWEALAVDPANEEVCLKAAQYILSLQYHDEALFNIPPHLTQQFAGGVMHDVVNHEAWTDSVGHALIAVARMSKFQ